MEKVADPIDIAPADVLLPHARQLQGSLVVREVANFREQLSPPAQKIYDNALTGTLFPVTTCLSCNRSFVSPGFEESAFVGQRHCKFGCESSDSLNLKEVVYKVAYLGATFTVPATSDALPVFVDKLQKISARLAEIMNIGASEQWLGFGVLARCSVIPLAPSLDFLSDAEKSEEFRYLVLVYPGLDRANGKTTDELNALFSSKHFTSEGGLPPQYE